MGDLIDGDDGLPAEEVGNWTKTKHEYLLRYVNISRKVRARWVNSTGAGATYIDPFCGPGRCKIKGSNTYIDGGVVAAWKMSVQGGAPFSRIFLADKDPDRLAACLTRLRALNAPVTEFAGEALATIPKIVPRLHPSALHFVFLDPFSLEALDFSIIKSLSPLKYIDILVHLSQMDLQRNLGANLRDDQQAFDAFAPKWRNVVDTKQSQLAIRKDVFKYWRDLVAQQGVWPSDDIRLITADKNQPLYWLLLAAKHDVAHAFWTTASNPEGQGSLFT